MEWLYFVVLIAFVAIMFTIVRRPMYEVIFLAFIFSSSYPAISRT